MRLGSFEQPFVAVCMLFCVIKFLLYRKNWSGLASLFREEKPIEINQGSTKLCDPQRVIL